LLRPGGISRAQIEAVIGPMVAVAGDDVPRAPGTTVSHYAPSTPLRLLTNADWASGYRPEAAVLALRSKPSSHQGVWLEAASDPVRYGHDLYASLRALDRLGAPLILVEAPPDHPDWEAVKDRLNRSAAAYRDLDLA
jgi:L-threonylcarbamoyladenylate synthase